RGRVLDGGRVGVTGDHELVALHALVIEDLGELANDFLRLGRQADAAGGERDVAAEAQEAAAGVELADLAVAGGELAQLTRKRLGERIAAALQRFGVLAVD